MPRELNEWYLNLKKDEIKTEFRSTIEDLEYELECFETFAEEVKSDLDHYRTMFGKHLEVTRVSLQGISELLDQFEEHPREKSED